jgi:phage terminase large subunit-like protein
MKAKIDLTIGNQDAQRQYMRDARPGWTLYTGGLGSGKTFASARKFLAIHAINGCPGLVVAPTYGDLLRFVLPGLVSACEACGLEYKLERSQLLQMHVLGQPIYAISAEHPERFAGFEVGHIWIDEGARIQASADDPLRDAPNGQHHTGRDRHLGSA